jgi:hypothetical protein
MKASELNSGVYEVLIRINYARKVNSFSESTASMFIHLADETKAVIKSFPVLDFDDDIDLMDIDTLDGDQQFYVFHNTTTDGYFLVDTQGYNYPRYITRLWGFMNEETDDRIDDTFLRIDGLARITDVTILESAVKSLIIDLKQEGFDKEDILNYIDSKIAVIFLEKKS